MGFKGREREGRIELEQVMGREKARKFKHFEIATKAVKHNFLPNYFLFFLLRCVTCYRHGPDLILT